MDKFYSDYDVVFPNKSYYVGKFKQVLKSLESIKVLIKDSRFKKKGDFYGLFSATAMLNKHTKAPVNLRHKSGELKKLARQLNKSPSKLSGRSARYHSTIIEGPNKLAKRKLRSKIILKVLGKPNDST